MLDMRKRVPRTVQPVILLHGWPYDIHSFVDVAPVLASERLSSDRAASAWSWHDALSLERDGPKWPASVIAVDIIALMDVLKIQKAVVRRFRWGARTANIIAALWPERCKAMVSVGGYLIGNREANKKPLPPKAELACGTILFSTDRASRLRGLQADFAKLIWQTASPQWRFDDGHIRSLCCVPSTTRTMSAL